MLSAAKGQIFLYSGTGFVAWLVKRVTKSKWSHAGWVTKDYQNANLLKDRFPYPIERCALVSLKMRDDQIEKCLSYAKDRLQREYDRKLILKLLWCWVFGWRRKHEKTDWCTGYSPAEAVAKPVLLFAKYVFNPEVSPHNIVPQDIWNFVVMSPSKAIITHIGREVS